MLRPRNEQHGPLEHIALDRLCLTQTKEQALDRVARQDTLIVVAVLFCVSEESGPDGCRRILDDLELHCMALMSGSIWPLTRSMAANFISSLGEVFRCRSASRSASMATSSPTWRRCLKQSATVFATP